MNVPSTWYRRSAGMKDFSSETFLPLRKLNPGTIVLWCKSASRFCESRPGLARSYAKEGEIKLVATRWNAY